MTRLLLCALLLAYAGAALSIDTDPGRPREVAVEESQ